MEIRQSFAKTRDCTISKKTISDKFGFFFAEHLPKFFNGGVSFKEIRKTMPKELFKEFCEEQNIPYIDEYYKKDL